MVVGLSKALPNPSHKGRGLEWCFQRQDHLVFVAMIASGLTNKSWDARNLAPPLVGGVGEGFVFFFPENKSGPRNTCGDDNSAYFTVKRAWLDPKPLSVVYADISPARGEI
jgi:hypothetical protein